MGNRHFSAGRFLAAILVIAFFLGIALVLNEVGLYYHSLDDYSGHLARGDQSAARDALKDLENFYQLNRKLSRFSLSWVADRFLFSEAIFHRAAFHYLIGDYGRVINDLQGEEHFWAYYLRANARWRQAQGIYANALNLGQNQQVMKDKQLKMADDLAKSLVKDDYALAIKGDPQGTLPPKWNYDLMTDDAARGRGLRPKPPKIRLKLGEKEGEGKDRGLLGDEGEGKAGTKTKELGNKGSQGPGKPGGKPKGKG